jgi:hypothetical protein
LPSSTLWCPNGRGLHSTPFKWSNDQLEYHGFSFLCLSPICEESPQLGASRPYYEDHKRCTEVREGRATHTRLKSQHNNAHKSQLELKTQPTEFTTQMELKSLSQRIKCAKLESWRLRMFLECLGWLLHALRGPFYSHKAARCRWRPTRKVILAFCRLVHRTVRCTTGQPLFMSGVWSPSYSGADDRCIAVTVCTPDTVRCTPDSPVPPADRWHGPRVARGLRGRPLRWRPLAHRTVRWIIAVRRQILPRVACSPESSQAHRTLSGVLDWAEIWLHRAKSFGSFLFSVSST